MQTQSWNMQYQSALGLGLEISNVRVNCYPISEKGSWKIAEIKRRIISIKFRMRNLNSELRKYSRLCVRILLRKISNLRFQISRCNNLIINRLKNEIVHFILN
jgi:hypothetical protein